MLLKASFVLLVLAAALLVVSVCSGQEIRGGGGSQFVTTVITPVEGDNYNIDLGDADLVKFQPTCYPQPGCQDEDGYSYTINSIVARPQKPRVLLYLGSYAGYTATIHHFGDGRDLNILPQYAIICPDFHDVVYQLTNHTIELYYDSIVNVWRPVQ